MSIMDMRVRMELCQKGACYECSEQDLKNSIFQLFFCLTNLQMKITDAYTNADFSTVSSSLRLLLLKLINAHLF